MDTGEQIEAVARDRVAEWDARVGGETKLVLNEVSRERRAQHLKWGEQNHPVVNPSESLQVREARERISRRNCEGHFEQGLGCWDVILREELAEVNGTDDPVEQRKELVQLAAVAVAAIEAIDRRERSCALLAEKMRGVHSSDQEPPRHVVLGPKVAEGLGVLPGTYEFRDGRYHYSPPIKHPTFDEIVAQQMDCPPEVRTELGDNDSWTGPTPS